MTMRMCFVVCAVLFVGLVVPVSAQTTFNFFLEPRNENPGTFSTEGGRCVGVLNEEETEFSLSCVHTVEDASNGHIHIGEVGVNGPVVFGFESPASPIDVVWELTEDDVADLLAGNLYVNIHSPANPGGDIRGQIANSEVVFRFPLEAGQETPAVDSQASGSCTGILAEGHTSFSLTCWHNVIDPTASHIHEAPPGESGGVIFPLGEPASPISAEWTDLTPENVTALFEGNLYVNVHSENFQDGEIRGQIVDDGSQVAYLSQFGNGVDDQGVAFTSDLVLANPYPTTNLTGRVEFRGDDGVVIPYPGSVISPEGSAEVVDTWVEFNIPPMGSVTIDTDGEGDLAVGSARLVSDGRVSAVIRFSISGSGTTGVGTSEAAPAFMIPVRRVNGVINTGVAIQSAEIDPMDITLTLVDAQGMPVENGEVVLEDFPGLGHDARFIDELFTDADTEDFAGTLIVRASGNGLIAGTALELGPGPGEFTTLPVTPLP